MAQRDHDPVLVTGCSTGIGRAIAEELLRQGHSVWATARRTDTIADLADRGAHVTALDVTDEASMAAAVARGRGGARLGRHPRQQRRLGEYGAVEEVDMDKVRAMFETNVFGLARMCQLVLPGDAPNRAGPERQHRVDGGRFTFPIGGYYHATKYAVEALTDALRMEVKGFGVEVALVEPGVTRSSFVDKTTEVRRDGRRAPLALRAMRGSVSKSNGAAYSNRMMSASAESVAQVVARLWARTARAPATCSRRRPSSWPPPTPLRATGSGTG